MSYRKPEGLSPGYNSSSSPDIPESFKFKWTPRHTQTGARIRLYAANGTTLLRTQTFTGSQTEFDMSNFNYSFVNNTHYHWAVESLGPNGYSTQSDRMQFKYERIPATPAIVWNHIPKEGDEVVRETYFDEIKKNVEIILRDYRATPNRLINQTRNLFTGDVVPDRTDFETLESVVDFLSTTLEDSHTVDIDGPVEDSLGVSDLEVIRNHIDMLSRVRPEQMTQWMGLVTPRGDMYNVPSIRTSRAGLDGERVTVSWGAATPIVTPQGSFSFLGLSPRSDIRYYRVRFEYGPESNAYISDLYFNANDVSVGTTRTFSTDWSNLYTANTLSTAMHRIRAAAVDQRGNESAWRVRRRLHGENLQVPLGLRRYELAYQKAPLSQSSPNQNGKWHRIYNGTNRNHQHNLSGNPGKIFYRIRARDLSGLVTNWRYSSGITWDPLKPPPPPKNFRAINIEKYRIRVAWDASKTATEYQVRRGSTRIWTGTTRAIWSNNLKANTNYTYYVRAGNRAGWSKWVSTRAKTLPARQTRTWNAIGANTWNFQGFWQNNNWVYQGQWYNPWSTDHYIHGDGSRWYGMNKGYWLFNHSNIRSTLRGKKIIKIELRCQRIHEHNGIFAYPQKPTFWYHRATSLRTRNPSMWGRYFPNIGFELGQRRWITLPNSYGNALRDGNANGIGIYTNGSNIPYIIFYGAATLRITYE